jgi:hypothetical protein
LTWFDPRTNSLENNNYYNDNSYIECDVEYAPDEPHGAYNFPNEFESYKDPYYFEGRLISPSFSIAIGVAELSYKINAVAKNLDRPLKIGIQAYNNGGKKQMTHFPYFKRIVNRLREKENEIGYTDEEIALILNETNAEISKIEYHKKGREPETEEWSLQD